MRALPLWLLASLALAAPAAAGDGCVDTTTVETRTASFSPFCVRIDAGDTLTWQNVGAIPHQLSSDEPAPVTQVTGEPCLQSRPFDPGESVRALFEKENDVVRSDGRECGLLTFDLAAYATRGETRITYHCPMHPSMQGEIVIV